jgi:hypothetical protein
VFFSHDRFAEAYERRWDASIDFALERQIGRNLCWAAVAKGIVDHYGGPRLRQCQYATTFLGQRKTCCRKSVPELCCDREHDVDSVLARYGNYALPFHRPIRLETIRRELERDRPVVALVRFPTSNHAVVVTAVDVPHGRVGVCDPSTGSWRRTVTVDELTHAYRGQATWVYTIITRPRWDARARATVSPLHEPMRQPDRDVRHNPWPQADSKPLQIQLDTYEANIFRLADGTGLATAERDGRRTVRLDAYDETDGSLMIDYELTKLREEIWARLERGFEVRYLTCFAVKLTALWFTDPHDPSHRTDHYIPVPPLYSRFDETREYSVAETREIFIYVAKYCIPSVEINQKWIERLDRETANQPDDPTI